MISNLEGWTSKQSMPNSQLGIDIFQPPKMEIVLATKLINLNSFFLWKIKKKSYFLEKFENFCISFLHNSIISGDILNNWGHKNFVVFEFRLDAKFTKSV